MSRKKTSKKSSAVKASKYVIPPTSPVGTRSKSGHKKKETTDLPPIDIVGESVASPVTATVPELSQTSETALLVNELEARWDT